MEASEMVDVLHYYFEDDYMATSTIEKAHNVTQFRKRLYGSLYGTTYDYGQNEGASASSSSEFEDVDDENFDVTPFDASRATKPYIPPTEPTGGATPFGDVLDGPVG